MGQILFDHEPISYSKTKSSDPVAQLQKKLDAGQVELAYDDDRGYLPHLLQLLNIDESSQVLVKSKTSFQLRRISPRTPRALYFNDQSYIGWVQNGDVIEVMSTDPKLGEVFYTLSEEKAEKPQFVRDRGQCIVCHASSRTQGVPGALVRSMFVDSRGQPHYGSGTFNIDHTSPFEKRWGGWYVTGKHGRMRHMGNVVSDRSDPEAIDRDKGANVTDLAEHFNVQPYLTPHSDIVALMILEHQTQMQNHLTHAAIETRIATHYDAKMNAALERPAGYVSDSTGRRTRSAGDKLLHYMLMSDEFALTSPVSGTSGYAEHFQAQGVRDSQGRSLRDLDLKTRLFKYPCSYLIYSKSFDQLPTAVKSYVTTRLHEVLTGKDQSEQFAHLSPADRKAIFEILSETKPDLWSKK